MEWLYYLLEANLYLLLFYGFYRTLLAKTTFYCSNRYFLITAILFSFLIPIVQIGLIKPRVIITDNFTYSNFENLSPTIGIDFILLVCYLIVCSLLTIKLFVSLSKIAYLWKNGIKHKCTIYTIIELSEKQSAFSFFNLLFIHPSLINNNTIIKHELVHIKEKHSLDLLLVECINVLCWFNPIIYFIKNDFKLLHEFIADQETTEDQNNKHQYAMFLIESSLYSFSIPFTNQFFNQQILKQRINMLNKEKTAKWVRLNFVLAIPLILGMLCVSTLAFSKDYGYFDILSSGKTLQDTTKKMRKPLPPPPPKQDRKPLPPPPPKQDQVKYPPPIVKPDRGNKSQEPTVQNIKKTKKDQVKFPPPIVKPDGENKSQEPTVQNIKKTKHDQVKFPPPVVKPDRKYSKNPPPVEPPPPGYKPKRNQIKFPPPILKPDGKNLKTPPPVEPPPPGSRSNKNNVAVQKKLVEYLENYRNNTSNDNVNKKLIEKQLTFVKAEIQKQTELQLENTAKKN